MSFILFFFFLFDKLIPFVRNLYSLFLFQYYSESVHNISANNVILLPRQNRYFTFNAGITDVDSKKLNRIEKHRQRTIRALNSITID